MKNLLLALYARLYNSKAARNNPYLYRRNNKPLNNNAMTSQEKQEFIALLGQLTAAQRKTMKQFLESFIE